jgi:hypothetical protein
MCLISLDKKNIVSKYLKKQKKRTSTLKYSNCSLLKRFRRFVIDDLYRLPLNDRTLGWFVVYDNLTIKKY